MTLVINGVDYPLTPDEWMFDPQTTSLAQGGSQMKFSMGPLGPQIMAQLEGPQNATALAHTDAKADAKTDRPLSKSRAKMLARGKEFKSSKVCASTIMKMEIKKSMFLVGDVFMRKYYTIFDRD